MRGREWRLEKNLYEHVREGYDRLAATYDEEIGSNPIGIRMRAIFRRALLAAIRPRALVFEIGCGTGTDAIWLAKRGIQVVATDISEEMLIRVREKARTEGVSERIQAKRLSAGEIEELRLDFGTEAFDGAFSHAGALNMEPDLSKVASAAAVLLKSSTPFVCSAINKTSLFEVLFYPSVLRPRKAFRRLDNIVPIPISRKDPFSRHVVPGRFYSPRELVRIFQGGFFVERIQGLQILLPPSNLAEYYAALRPVFAPFERLEDALSTRWPVNSWGHHSILTLRRRPR